ncbi:CIS tube protein [Mucilaginibacter polytrichastri]|uniref:LysM domain-containing protein n=1 Tax=Mucilaginibacter polytrichastri TaxID=1302689 RepID=A0A1Q5ZXP7_9SPHI|nr:LysM peptidoglycan-binding domain-containing protein [Mucilaginibacter polytrichastri]OKS86517.1 hypothetical protein RG47T_1973 [Mucilaginibacter polytrichastri]SFS79380.1 hypothetical protein SAMN04487890_10491 [Mucilaginibacter polytrichastri]
MRDNTQTLIKLKIQAFKDPPCKYQKAGEIDAFINPSKYQRTYSVIYSDDKALGATDSTQVFKRIGQSDLTLSFFVDGTGIVPLAAKYKDVDDYIDTFTNLVYGFQGNIHRPFYLLIIWGRLTFTGVCSKLDVTYNLFTPAGKALRATIDITITQSKDYKTKAKEAAKSSPDLTHVRTVRAGDTLPLMSYRIYGDSSYYMEIAKANGLSSFQAIKPGDQIYFPPIKK